MVSSGLVRCLGWNTIIFQIAPVNPKIAPINWLDGGFFFFSKLAPVKKKYFDPCRHRSGKNDIYEISPITIAVKPVNQLANALLFTANV